MRPLAMPTVAAAALLLSACAPAPEPYALPCSPTVVHKEWGEDGRWIGDARVTPTTSPAARSLDLLDHSTSASPTMAAADLLISYSPAVASPRATALSLESPYRLLVEAPPRESLSPLALSAVLTPFASGCSR